MGQWARALRGLGLTSLGFCVQKVELLPKMRGGLHTHKFGHWVPQLSSFARHRPKKFISREEKAQMQNEKVYGTVQQRWLSNVAGHREEQETPQHGFHRVCTVPSTHGSRIGCWVRNRLPESLYLPGRQTHRHTWHEDSFLRISHTPGTAGPIPGKAGQTSKATPRCPDHVACSRAENTLSGSGLLGENTGCK